MKNNFLDYWAISDDSNVIEDIKFDKESRIFSVSRTCNVTKTIDNLLLF